MHRPAQRLTRILTCAAAVPVIFIASGCSSDSGSGSDGAKKDSGSKASASASGKDKAATVEKAAFDKLPEPCDVLSKKTLDDLVPEAKDKSGKAGTSDDTSARGTCSWDSLDNNGVDGSQFRWLRVSLMRFDSDASLGSGAKRAQNSFAKQVADAQATEGAKSVKTEPVPGMGDQTTVVHYDLKKDKENFKQQTVVTRVENAVVTIDYNGAGLAGDKAPSSKDLSKDAEKAAKEAAEAVAAANKAGGTDSGSKESGSKESGSEDSKDSSSKDSGSKDSGSKDDDSTSSAKSKSSSKPKS
ncbi:DUF3558 domain-containing protein [Streptomyces sp. NPDC054855]